MDVEFYFVAGAVLSQVLRHGPSISRPRDVFAPTGEADPLEAYAAGRGWGGDWATAVVRGVAGHGRRRFIDIPHLAVFEPPPEYALAVKVAMLPAEPSPRQLEDLRFLLRASNLHAEDGARASISRYVAERHQPSHARVALRSLLNA